LLDEFARLGKIENIIDGLATLRSKKITMAIILQSLAQLELIYGRATRKVIADTCAFKAVLGATDAETQKYFSQLVGTYDKLRAQCTQNYNTFDIHSGSSVQSSEDGARPIIKPEEFATLQEDLILLYPLPFNFCRVKKQPYYLKNVNML
jgi:type IV secretion system protein VirD4